MARLQATLRIDTSRMQPLYAMCDSLAEACATAHFDEPIPVESSVDGLRFEGHLIVVLKLGKIVGLSAAMLAIPTVHLPLFVAEVCRRATGVRATWTDGWPHFSAPGDDRPDEPDPTPTTPEALCV